MRKKLAGVLIAIALLATLSPSPVWAASWLTGWDYRKKITVDNTKVPATLTNFPVVVVLASDSDLAAHAASDATDLRVTSSDGTTTLDYERELWNSTTGELVLHFRAPSLSSSADTEFYLYYGKSGAADGENATGVWDSNFKMVQHLHGAAYTSLDDSTNNNNDIDTEVGAPAYQQAGKVGHAISLDGDDYIEIAAQTFTDLQGTIEVWVRSGTSNGWVAASADTASSTRYFGARIYLSYWVVQQSNSDTASVVRGSTTIDDDMWHHCVVVSDGASYTMYVDGGSESLIVIAGTNNGDWFGDTSGRDTVALGALHRTGTEGYVTGQLDEARISDVARSSDWIAATYNNQSSPSTFYALGSEETSIPPTPTPTPSPTPTPTPTPTPYAPPPPAGSTGALMAEMESEIPSEGSWTTWAAAVAAIFDPVIEALDGAHDGAVAARDDVCGLTETQFLPGDDYNLSDISLPEDPSPQEIIYQMGLALGRPVGYLRGIEESGVADLNFLSILIWGTLGGISWIGLVAFGVWAMHAARWVLNVAIRIYELIPFKST